MPVMQTLCQMADSDRIPHAMLLSGPAGAGKLLMAETLIRYIHCLEPENGRPCGHCDSCLQHASFNNADTIYVFPTLKRNRHGLSEEYMDEWREFRRDYPYAAYDEWLRAIEAGNSQPVIYVAEADDLVRRLNMTNLSAKYKMVLFWLPEKLQPEAANKLLKIIEEPFDDTKFIFVSELPNLILPTVLSRLQHFRLGRLGMADLAAGLESDYAVAPEAAAEAARLAEGDINRALLMLRSESETQEFRSVFQNLMRMAYARDVRKMLAWSDAYAAEGREKIIRLLRFVAEALRQNYIYNLGEPALVNLAEADAAFSHNFARFITDANIGPMSDETDRAIRDVAGNVNPRIVLFDYCVRMLMYIRKQ